MKSMKKNLDNYLDTLFAEMPDNDYAKNIKIEVRDNVMSGYDDCINSGMSPAAAYAEAIKALGDADELIEAVKNNSLAVVPETDLSFVQTDYESIPIAGKFVRLFDTFFRNVTPNNENAIQNGIISIMWIIITIMYFLGSFITGWWHVSWLIFLAGSMITIFIDMLFGLNKLRRKTFNDKIRKKMIHRIHGAASGIFWLAVTIVYFLGSFMTGWWHVSWLIFLVASVVQIIMSTFFSMIEKQ